MLGRIGFAKDYFSKGLNSESPAEGSGREELADVEDLISDKSEVCNRSNTYIDNTQLSLRKVGDLQSFKIR